MITVLNSKIPCHNRHFLLTFLTYKPMKLCFLFPKKYLSNFRHCTLHIRQTFLILCSKGDSGMLVFLHFHSEVRRLSNLQLVLEHSTSIHNSKLIKCHRLFLLSFFSLKPMPSRICERKVNVDYIQNVLQSPHLSRVWWLRLKAYMSLYWPHKFQ